MCTKIQVKSNTRRTSNIVYSVAFATILIYCFAFIAESKLLVVMVMVVVAAVSGAMALLQQLVDLMWEKY